MFPPEEQRGGAGGSTSALRCNSGTLKRSRERGAFGLNHAGCWEPQRKEKILCVPWWDVTKVVKSGREK